MGKFLALKNPAAIKSTVARWKSVPRNIEQIVAEEAEPLAESLVTELQKRIRSSDIPGEPEHKVAGRPWIETKTLLNSVQVIHDKTGIAVGIPPGIMEETKRRLTRGPIEVTKLAFDLEVGATVGHTHYPPHPLLRQTVADMHQSLSEKLTKRIAKRLS